MNRTFLLVLFFCGLNVLAASARDIDSTRLGSRSLEMGSPNDCLPAAMRVYHELPPAPTCQWKRLLSARYGAGRRNHVYCVFAVGSQIYAYDTTWGSRRVYPTDRSASAVARVVDFAAVTGVYLN